MFSFGATKVWAMLVIHMTTQSVPRLLLALAVVISSACQHQDPVVLSFSPSAIPSKPTTPSDGVVTLAGVSVTGNTKLLAVGDTSQLMATASLSDGTSKDVTAEAEWTTADSDVITFQAPGLLRVVNLGVTSIFVVYQNRSTIASVTAIPPGTVAITGRVREPGQSGLNGVRVTELSSGRPTTTKVGGQFSIAGFAPGAPLRLRAEKAGYEQPSDLSVTAGQPNVDIPLQRTIRFSAGDTVNPPPLAPHDTEYVVGGQLCRCRLLRMMMPAAGTVNVKLSWTGSPAGRLSLIAGGQTFTTESAVLTADVVVTMPGEHVMYVGDLSQQRSGYATFTLETAMR
jgi:hypothetical protein